MSSADTIVPIMFFLIVVGAPVAAWVISRVLAHQERMEMLRRGFTPPPDHLMVRNAMKYGAKHGWTPGMALPEQRRRPDGLRPAPTTRPTTPKRSCAAEFKVAFIGFALLIGLSFIGFHDGRYVYGPWLLGGLIPMFVGIAQVISAVLSGAQITPMGSAAANGSRFGPPEHGAEAPASAGRRCKRAPPAAGFLRRVGPGPMLEIEKPAGPPDRL